MIEGIISLASYGFAGGEIGKVLSDLEQAGFFAYVLPFLLIFAIIFGILSSMKIFESNKSINAVISLAVSLMALQTGLVSDFFTEVTPFLGVGLVLLLITIIFLGFFAPKKSGVIYAIWGVAAIILVNIFLKVAENMNSPWFSWWQDYKSVIIGGIVIVIILVIIANAGNEDNFEENFGDNIKKIFSRK